MQRARLWLALAAVVVITGLVWLLAPGSPRGPETSAVVAQYAAVAHATYADSTKQARALQQHIDSFLAAPSAESLDAARTAWRAARVPYMQSEAFRFGNPVVDRWEPQVNAWPLDEGLIDYVAGDYSHEQANPAARANIIASDELQAAGKAIDVGTIDAALLTRLNEIGGSEANVATGYHAIEFLLWGQDLHGTGAGAGERPYTDYLADERCTDGPAPAPVRHCERRRTYLHAAVVLLVEDLDAMTAEWAPDSNDNYRAELIALPAQEGLRRMLFGIGSLALGELAGERMRVALLAHSTEDEHDCFSDNTHMSHYYDLIGIGNVVRGSYAGNADSDSGAGLAGLLAARAPDTAQELKQRLAAAERALGAIRDAAEDGEHFDQMIATDNTAGRARIRDAIAALVALAASIQHAADTLGISDLRPDTAGHTF